VTRHIYRCPLRWSDQDAQGHINNVVVVDYLQEARVDFLLSSPLADMLTAGVLVVSHQVEYLRPIEFSTEPIRVELWADSVGAARFAISYELFAGAAPEHPVARARTVITPFDLTANTIRRLTVDERALLADAAEPAIELRPLARIELPANAFVWPCRVRWSDLDAYGHVNNVKFFEFLQESRIATIAPAWQPDQTWLLVRQDLEYRTPLDFSRTPYPVHVAVAALGTSSMTLATEIRDPAGTVYATARTVIVLADLNLAPIPLTDALRTQVAGYAV